MTAAVALPRARHSASPRAWRRTLMLALATVALVLVGGAAWAYWLASTTVGSNGAAAATSVNAGATPTANVSGTTVTVSWAASTLASGQAVTGYQIRRYNSTTLVSQTVLSACTGTVAALSCIESSVPIGTWLYSVTPVIGTNWVGAESAMSAVVTVDPTPPVNALSLSNVTGGAVLTGTTVYYRGAAAGSFTVTNTLTDVGSGPASSQTAALGGTTTGWTHTPSTVSTPSGGPYVSNSFSWAAATTSSPTEAVTGRDVVSNTAVTNLTFTNDSTAPTVGTLTYTNGYQPARSVVVTLPTPTDGGSGVVTRQLQRQQAPLTGGTCGVTYSGFVNIGSTAPASPYTDSAVVNAMCYIYRYVVTDAVGNQTIVTSANVAKVDYAGAVSTTSGVLSQWRMGDPSTASAMDDVSATNNNGTYFNTPTPGIVGAIANDANTAVSYDGINEYSLAARQIANDFSIEFWVKSSQNYVGALGGQPECSQWWQGAGLVDADLGGTAYDFGVSMCKGKIVAGAGGTSEISVATPGTYNNSAWHHVVVTRTQTSGVIVIYVDGAQVASVTAGTGVLNAQANLNFGRLGFDAGYFAGSLDEVAVYNVALPAATVTNHYQLGVSPASDTTGPTGGSVDAVGLTGTGSRYSTSTNLSIGFTPGTDVSGLIATGRTLMRATATLTTGTCGSYGSYTLVTGGTDPTSPKADTVTDAACYRYQYTVSDTLGNPTTYTSGDIKVDTTAPSAPTFTVTSPVNTYWSGPSSTVYYNSGAASGSFTVTGLATDPQSGIASYGYPAAGTNWTSTPGALGVNTYSWSGAPAAPGTKNVTATSNAGTASSSSPLTFVADNTAPSPGSVSYVNAPYAGTTITVSFTTGTEAGSGIASRLLQRATATLSGTTCGAFGGFTTVVGGTNPTSPFVDTVAASGACYMYRYVVTDNLGLQDIATSASVARSPGAIWAMNEGFGTTTADTSGNARTATLVAGATWSTRPVAPLPPLTTSPTLSLNGTTQYAQFGGPVVNTDESFTIAAWVRLDDVSGYQTIAAIDGTNVSPFFLGTNGSNGFRFAHVESDSTTGTFVVANGGTATANTWYHVAGVYDKQAGTIKLYVNGTLVDTQTTGASWTATGTTTVGAAKWNGARTDFVDGRLDEVRFYGRALTLAEVQALAAG
jgi:hypothetical protein